MFYMKAVTLFLFWLIQLLHFQKVIDYIESHDQCLIKDLKHINDDLS